MPNPIQEDLLCNGARESRAVVLATMLSLERLWTRDLTGMCSVVELHDKIKNPDYVIEEPCIKDLVEAKLLKPDGSCLPAVRNVVLSAIKGEGGNRYLGSPIPEPA